MRALFHAYWVEGDDLSDSKVIESALTKAGLDGKRLIACVQEQEIKDELRKNTDLAPSCGVFGVPMIFVGELRVWGNDRIEFVQSGLRLDLIHIYEPTRLLRLLCGVWYLVKDKT